MGKATTKLGMMMIVLASFFSGSWLQAMDSVSVSLFSAPFGTGSYVLGSALEEISKKNHSWLTVTQTESPGLVYNIKKMEQDAEFKRNTLIVSADLLVWLARNGMPPLDKTMGKDIKVIGVFNHSVIWFGTLDSSIKSLADLKGKKVALGTKAQIGWGIQASWYLDDGWDLKNKATYQWIGMDPGLTALMDGLVDVIPIGGYVNPIDGVMMYAPTTNQLLASGKTVYHLSVGENALNKIKKIKPGAPLPLVTIPAAQIAGSQKDKDMVTSASAVFWAASEQFPQEWAYEIAKLLIQHVDKFKNYHGLGKLMTKESLCFGVDPQEFHTGAYQAYKEAGLVQ